MRGDASDRTLVEHAFLWAPESDSGLNVHRFVRVAARPESGAALPPNYVLRHGGREDQLLQAAVEERADLLVVGVHSRSHRRKLARRLAMKAPCSVLVVPENYPSRVRGILAAVDFSEHSAEALHLAATLARQFGLAQVTALHVYFDSTVVSYPEHEALEYAKESDRFHSFLRPLRLYGVEIEQVLEESSSLAHAIEAASAQREIDLIVMGIRGRSPSAAILLGSQTERMIQETTRPLLAVKRPGRSLKLLEALLRALRQETPRFG